MITLYPFTLYFIFQSIFNPEKTQDSIKGRKNAFKHINKKWIKVTFKMDVPIILVIGYSDPISQNMALELGVEKILIKPFRAHELIDAVEDSLKTGESCSLSFS